MSDIIKFFDALYGQQTVGEIEVAYTRPDSGAPTQCRHIDVGDFDTIEEVSDDIALEGSNQYFIPSIIKEGTKGRSSDDDIKSATCVFADFDGEGDLQRASKIWKDLDISPPWVVITGRHPHIRGHAYWPLDGQLANMTAFREIQQQLASVLGGDTTVQNPSRLMRMPGSIAWPKKPGRVKEATEIQHRDQNQQTFSIIELRKTLNGCTVSAPTSNSADNVVPINGSSLNLGLNDSLDIKGAWDKALSSDNWHHNVIKMVASWVHRGFTDFEIHQLSDQLTLDGYTTQDTANEVQKAIDSARLKWGIAQPTNVLTDLAGRQEQNDFIPASQFRGEPPAREWILQDWIPRGTVTALFGDGGVGKTLIAQQLANCLALGRGFMNTEVRPSNVLFIACEDDTEELHRRQHAINSWLDRGIQRGPKNLYLWPRVGFDNIMASFKEGEHAAEAFYDLIKDAIEKIQTDDKDTVIFLDTAADMYGGNENSRREVNMFLKTYLGGLCVQYRATIIVLAHPSVAGMASGSGMSGSTAWNNGVRGRFYLTKADGGLDEERVLSRKKSNYSSAGDEENINLIWEAGVLQEVKTTSSNTISRIAHNSCINEAMITIDRQWRDGSPFKGNTGNAPRKAKLSVALPKALSKAGHDRKVIANALREIEQDELISIDKQNTGTTTQRGYRLSDAGLARLEKRNG